MKQGSWYWVKIKDKWSPAQYDIHAAGGWTNEDTWEDFDKEVVDWQLIIPPNEAYSVEGDTMFNLIKSEPIEITELRIRKTFEYYVGDERLEYSLIASQEFWADEQMANAIVEGKIKQAIEDYKKSNI